MENTLKLTSQKEEKLVKIIDKVVNQIFGKEATSLIYRYLEDKYNLKKSEIAEKIDIFAEGLEGFLTSGAYIIERKILEDIYSNYGLLRRMEIERMQETYDFASQVKMLMRDS